MWSGCVEVHSSDVLTAQPSQIHPGWRAGELKPWKRPTKGDF